MKPYMEFEMLKFDGYLRCGGPWFSVKRRSFLGITAHISGRSQ